MSYKINYKIKYKNNKDILFTQVRDIYAITISNLDVAKSRIKEMFKSQDIQTVEILSIVHA